MRSGKATWSGPAPRWRVNEEATDSPDVILLL